MRQPMSARERVLLTFLACATVLALGPLTALAATGQLMNIVDPTNAARIAKVTDIGALQVQTRPGLALNSFNGRNFKGGGGWMTVYEHTSTKATAIVEATLATGEGAGIYIYRIGFATAASTTACSSLVTYTAYAREIHLKAGETMQLDFSGAPLQILAPTSGKKVCIGIFIQFSPPGGTTAAGLSGYLYTP